MPEIIVLAGVNGAGKSSVGGQYLQSFGMDWFNPDAMARSYRAHARSQPTIEEANAYAWRYGYRKLQQAIANKLSYAFETTLGGESITQLLKIAAQTHELHVLYCGLESVELHIERVQRRVSEGGHAIPESAIRKRWVHSRQHLIDLMPYLTSLRVFDNSVELDPVKYLPSLRRIIKIENQRLIAPDENDVTALRHLPGWAKPIAMRALLRFAD